VNISQFSSWLDSLNKHPLIMGILNVTPDSFSDGGKFLGLDSGYNHAMKMVDEGADIIDIGGESTRPFSSPVSIQEELDRVLPILRKIRSESDITISIDTTKAHVAKEALLNGANFINDISGLSFDNQMIKVVQDFNCPIVIMHIQGNPKTMQINPSYENVINDIKAYFISKINFLNQSGIRKNNIILDPGIGFGKSVEDNFKILSNVHEFVEMKYPILIGASRKSFIGKTLDTTEDGRLEGSIAANLFALQSGCHIFRVHDVIETKRAFMIHNKILNTKE
jgi:dihydropteroate synthase